MGNVEELTTKTDVEKKELKSTGKYDYGQAISAIVIPKPTQIELKFSSFDKYALAYSFAILLDVSDGLM